MGFASDRCIHTAMETDKIVLSCDSGNVTEIVDFGINARFEDRDQCLMNKTGACANSLDRAKIQ